MPRDARVLDVRITENRGAATLVVSLSGKADRSDPAYALPMLGERLAGFAASLGRWRPRRVRESRSAGRAANDAAETIGRELFTSLFPEPKVFADALDAAREAGALLRIRLKFDTAPEAAALPWELLMNGDDHLAQQVGVSVVRFTDFTGASPTEPAARVGPLRILVLAPSPVDLPALQVKDEFHALEAALAPLGDRVELRRVTPPTAAELRRTLDEEQGWNVLHYMGHADIDLREALDPDGAADGRRPGEDIPPGGVLALEKDDRTRDIVGAADLVTWLRPATALRLAVLNGCSTGAASAERRQTGVAQALVKGGVSAAVAHQFPVTDTSAITFARVLYEQLVAGDVIDDAVVSARRALMTTPEWVTPVLFANGDEWLFGAAPEPVAPPVPFSVRDEVPQGTVPPEDEFEPRMWLVDEIVAWLGTDSRVLLLAGGHGAGKTVLAGWLAGQGPEPPDEAAATRLREVRSAWHAVRIGSTALAGAPFDPRAFVRSLAAQLEATVPGFATPDPRTADPALLAVDDLVRRQLVEPLQAARRAAGAQPVVMLVDGLGEAGGPPPDAQTILALLAEGPGAPVRMVLCGSTAALRPFGAAAGAQRLDLSSDERRPQVDADIAAYLRRRLAGTGLADDVLARVVAAAEGNFLYASHAADALRADPTAAEHLDLPSGLDEAHERWVLQVLDQRAEGDWRARWATEIAPLLAHLAVARAPVPFAALRAWLGWTGPQLSFQLEALAQLVAVDEDGIRLVHPSLAAMLLRQQLGDHANVVQVDGAAAHRRVVEHATGLREAELAAPEAAGATYDLVHAPGHLAALLADPVAAADPATDRLVDSLAASVVKPGWAHAMATARIDPAVIGTPYHDLVAVLLARGRTGEAQALVALLAHTPVPALRGAVMDAFAAYVAHDLLAATKYLVDSAVGADRELAALALHATCLLPAADQATAFTRIVTAEGGDEELATAAAFALYANGRADPGLIENVLGQMLPRISLLGMVRRQPREAVKFFGRVTVTNYINQCHDEQVAEATSRLWQQLLVDRLHVRFSLSIVGTRAMRLLLVRRLSERIASLFVGADADWPGGPDVPGADSVRRVVPVLDPAVSIEPVEADLAVLLRSDVVLLRILAALAVAVHAIVRPDQTEPLVERLAAGGDERARRWLLFGHAVVLPETPASWVPMLERATKNALASPHADEPDGAFAGLHLTFVPLALAYAKAGLPMTALDEALGQGDEGWRQCLLEGLGAAGMYHPDAVLAAIGGFVDAGRLTPAESVPALALMAGVHPLRTRAWLLARDLRGVLAEVAGSVQPTRSRSYLEALGMYNNAVHQAVHYPKMRVALCQSAFTHFLGSRSLSQWLDRWADEGLRLLRSADYTLIEWTR